MTGPSWKRIVVSASVLSGLIAAVLIVPLAREGYAAHVKKTDELRYATGLSACTSDQNYLSRYVDGDLPGVPDISIDAFHTFSAPEALRIVGQEIFFFRVRDRLDPNSDFLTYRSTLSGDTSQALISALATEVAKAHERTFSNVSEIVAVDGSTYYFRQGKSTQCGFARIYEQDSRVKQIIDLYYSSMNYTTQSTSHPVSESQLGADIRALKMR